LVSLHLEYFFLKEIIMRVVGHPGVIGLEKLGIDGQTCQYWNLAREDLIQQIKEKGDCEITDDRVVIARTGKFTGRSPNDKYIVNYHAAYDDQIDWGKVNKAVEPDTAAAIFDEVKQYLVSKEIYIQDLQVGHHPVLGKAVRIVTESAWASLFARNLFINSESEIGLLPDYTIIQVPGFFADATKYGLHSGTFIILDFEKHLGLIGGTAYAGEIKKSVFTIMNRILPEQNVLPMHCSANIGENGDTALFFGLSGTGKTTLSSDPDRRLIGDDEHGWGVDGVFNFEGGCYAKTIGLKKEYEPLIWNACQRTGTVLENVVYNKTTGELDFDDGLITENTRAAYPLEYIANYEVSGRGGHPDNVFFLSADAFGVLPPISLLDKEQAMYYFLSGFTAKLAGTELGLGNEPQATFSSCFGAPFLPMKPMVYADLLGKLVAEHKSRVWLINTGWSGGAYGTGSRMKLPYTRALIKAAINGELIKGNMAKDTVFNLSIPAACSGVPVEMLDPIKTWQHSQSYIETANHLLTLFEENYKQFSI
jgi:phosphoenolpyruvate carboxykinase (ATP)